MARDAAFEQVEVVADSHGEGEQLLEPLLRLVELDRDAAGFEAHTGREVLKLLIDDGGRRFDQQLGLGDPLLAQVFDEVGHFAPALDLVGAFVAFCDALQPGDQGIAVGEPVDARAPVQNTGRHDLLSPAAANAEQELDGWTVNVRQGMLSQLFEDVG